MKPSAILVGLLAATGCAQAGQGAAGDDDGHAIDAPAGRIDAPAGRDAPGPGGDAPHAIDAPLPIDAPAVKPTTLLLSEVMLAPTAGEFIEIVNPTASAVTLTDYYLADRGDYWKLPLGPLTNTPSDFVAQFPAGAVIQPGGVVTVSIGAAQAFTNTTGTAPTYSIADATMIKTQVGASAGLTDAGEIIVLFQWDGSSSLVKDVDMLLAGVPTATNGLVSKSDMTQGTATYATDLNTLPAQATAPGSGLSTKRILLEAGHETQAGTGNGITGDDETSEQTTVTWDSTATFSGPTPGTVPADLIQ